MDKILRTLSHAIALLLILPIRFYQTCITPYTPPACRFTPTCSEYARQALLRHGPVKGLLLATWRILRCNPWGGSGYDPVPDTCTYRDLFARLTRKTTTIHNTNKKHAGKALNDQPQNEKLR